MGTSFQVDPDAAAAAKASGKYGDDEGKADDEKEVVLSDEDPDKPDDADDDDSDDDSEDDSDDSKTDDDDESKDDDDDDDKEGEDDDKASAEFSANQTKWTKEFLEKGELSEETRTEIAKSVFAEGVPQEVKDQYVLTHEAGLKALANAASASAFEIVGGVDEYQAMTAWAKTNLSEQEIEAFDADALGSDIVRRDTAIRGLHARMQQAAGAEPDNEPDLAHDGGRGKGEPIIGSRQELAKIMGTNRYKTDPAYRELVERQVRQSRKTGKYRTS